MDTSILHNAAYETGKHDDPVMETYFEFGSRGNIVVCYPNVKKACYKCFCSYGWYQCTERITRFPLMHNTNAHSNNDNDIHTASDYVPVAVAMSIQLG